ncbi:GTP-binding protein [Candidatus Dojkabacteria bacterium]|nr:GTP-binding protein [Candidatus Dojkabacteria bacterium]
MDIVTQDKIRNIAVIAHVDHGKTTLIDAFLKQTHVFRENQIEMAKSQILDSFELEREKGITIKAKNTSVRYNGYKINIIDTPGHADFGGEVERILNMVNGCLLIVDAQEGPMVQTKFVLRKAFEMNLKIIVVINKIDKKLANPKKTLDKINDLFLSIAKDEDQLNFPILYAIGREGKVFKDLPPNVSETKGDITILLDEIINSIPVPDGDPDKPFQMQVSSLDYDEHFGRFIVGTVKQGTINIGDSVQLVSPDSNSKKSGTVKCLRVREGLNMVNVECVQAGEIAAVSGIDSADISWTLCDPSNLSPISDIQITPPSMKITLEENTSPLVGQDGKCVTMKQIERRLLEEKEVNIALKIEKNDKGGFDIAGRGELQLGILIETLRREGYEFQIRKPEVVYKIEKNTRMEPLEELVITVGDNYIGTITTQLSSRNAKLENLETENGIAKFTYKILTRDILGLRSKLMRDTKGSAVMQSSFLKYVPYSGKKVKKRNGVLISATSGTALGYSLNSIQERGDLFTGPKTLVYEGMIIGIHKYEQDLEVDVTRERHKSAHRIRHDEITQSILRPLIPITIDFAFSFLENEEMLEVTPHFLRLRKVYLSHTQRKWARRKVLSDYARRQLGL